MTNPINRFTALHSIINLFIFSLSLTRYVILVSSVSCQTIKCLEWMTSYSTCYSPWHLRLSSDPCSCVLENNSWLLTVFAPHTSSSVSMSHTISISKWKGEMEGKGGGGQSFPISAWVKRWVGLPRRGKCGRPTERVVSSWRRRRHRNGVCLGRERDVNRRGARFKDTVWPVFIWAEV